MRVSLESLFFSVRARVIHFMRTVRVHVFSCDCSVLRSSFKKLVQQYVLIKTPTHRIA